MSEEALLRLEDVSLEYRVRRTDRPPLKEAALSWLRPTNGPRSMWALRNVSLSVARGEAVGVIGANGAGKTSLVRVVAGLLPPTRGSVRRRGRIAPLLGIGGGFDLELDGYENIMLSGLLQGRSLREIRDRTEWIAGFSGLQEFLRCPMRTYSTGMLVRLGFAIAVAWPADLILVDEALAVGDAGFLARCRQRIDELRREGSALLLVAHHAATIGAFCPRCLWLDDGRVLAEGPSAEVFARFAASAGTRADLTAGRC